MKTKSPQTAIILAGGLGTRLRSVIRDLPKPMAPINNKPFLELLINYWIERGINSFVISVGYKKSEIINFFGEQYLGASISYAEENSPLGTGGGMLRALQLCQTSQDIIVINGDTYFDIDYQELINFHHANSSLWTFSLKRMRFSERYLPICVEKTGKISSFNASRSGKSVLINGGVYIINTRIFDNFDFKESEKLSLENDLIPLLYESGINFFGLESKGQFIDIGIPEDYILANSCLG